MLARTKWRVVERPCGKSEALVLWREAATRGCVGAVTSWGSGMAQRDHLRLYWEVAKEDPVPEGEDLVEEDWRPFWRESLEPVRVSERFGLVPAWLWEERPARENLLIDPGMAFGSGDHPTTLACVKLLEQLCDVGEVGLMSGPVIDVGTGTGVLAMVAALLGGAKVDGLDIDPFGYAACRRNASLNGLQDRIIPHLLSLDLVEKRYPFAIANIVAPQLMSLSAELDRIVEMGGGLMLSGFEDDGVGEVVDWFSPDFTLERTESIGGWAALLLRRVTG